MVQPATGRLGTVRLSAVAPTVSAGLLVVPTQVPPIVAELALILVSVSVKLELVNATELGLLRVKVIVLVPPGAIVAGLNALAIVGDTPFTTRLAMLDTEPAIGVCEVVTPDVVFGLVPTLVLVT